MASSAPSEEETAAGTALTEPVRRCDLPGVEHSFTFNISLLGDEKNGFKGEIKATNMKTKQRYILTLEEEKMLDLGKDMLEPEQFLGLVRSCLVQYVEGTEDEERDSKMTAKAVFVAKDAEIKRPRTLAQLKGRTTATEGDALLVAVEYKPDSFLKFIFPLRLTEVETSAVDRLESRLDEVESIVRTEDLAAQVRKEIQTIRRSGGGSAERDIVQLTAAVASRVSVPQYRSPVQARLYQSQPAQNGSYFCWNTHIQSGTAFANADNAQNITCNKAGLYRAVLCLNNPNGNTNGYQVSVQVNGTNQFTFYCHQFGGQHEGIFQVQQGQNISVYCQNGANYFDNNARLIVEHISSLAHTEVHAHPELEGEEDMDFDLFD